MKSIERALAELDRRSLDYKKKCSVYEPYRTAASPAVESETKSEEIPLPASIHEQEARFEAITSKMSMQVQDLEKQLQKTAATLNR